MILFAVQGYAQRERHESRRGHRTEQRSENPRYRQNRPPRREYTAPQRNTPSRQSGYGSRYDTPHRQDYRRAPSDRYYRPPQPHHRPAPPAYYHRPVPVYRHHHDYYHHRHHCYFDDWYWYSWGGYRNRFICHRHYHNRYFDSMLGYYIWGALTAPTRLDIGNMTFTRYDGMLQIRIGNQYTNLDLYISRSIVYKVGYTTVNVSVGNGYASILFYDEYGNQASYTL